MKKYVKIVITVLMAFALFSCSASFKDVAAKHGFNSGYAITSGDILDPNAVKIIKNDCNILVYENSMKWANLRPNDKFWNWNDIDLLIKFAQENNMKVKWHTLFWHQQNSNFVSSNWTREKALAMMDEHIETIMTRYKGKISEYDVVNEMFEEDGSLRQNVWLKTIGPDYIEHALIKARQVDPDAKLYLNDYNNEEKGYAKSDAMYKMAKDFVERGIPLDGIGMQLHLDVTLNCSENAIRKNLERYQELGLDVSFSELDIRVPTSKDVNPDAYNAVQQDRYLMIYKLASQMPCVKSVILWGYTDKHSWVPSTFPGKGNALVYDKDVKQKPVYKAIYKQLKSK